MEGGDMKTEEAEKVEGAPELPPRPPHPCHRHLPSLQAPHNLHPNRLRKYVFLCSVCGGLASLLGALFMAVYLILRSYTSSLDYFETIPTYIPAAMLLITGLGIMCLARRRNRYAFLIKLCGVCCLLCAAICVLVTVTTTVIHMSRLQSLRECVYTIKTQTCTCYSMLLESASERTDEGAHYVFNSTPDCEVIHGALYSCLRAMFGLSVIGILVCIFCCMLVYQLLSHERKKMYWEQLELRCRYLYGQPRTAPQRCSHCPCNTMPYNEPRLWAGGRIGNLYSPNPVGDEVQTSGGGGGWAWRLPWSRGADPPPPTHHPIDPPRSVLQPFHINIQHQHSRSNSNDGQGFGSWKNQSGDVMGTLERGGGSSGADSQYGFSTGPGHHSHHHHGSSVATVSSYTGLVEGQGWGPPPPYSDPSSPRRPGPSSNYANAPPLARKPPLLRPRPNKRTEPTESEVYFADVSSCCNGSVVYDEAERPVRKQPRFVPQERSLRIHRIPEERASPEACSDMALDGSEEEEEDPELVSFSNRQGGGRGGRVVEASPMSVSSPSEAGGHYQGGSDAGSQDSVWSGYSRHFLAPDAQYETIPDTRETRPPPNIGKCREWGGSYQEQEPVRFMRNINSPRAEVKNLPPKQPNIRQQQQQQHQPQQQQQQEEPPQDSYDVENSYDRCGNLPAGRYYDDYPESRKSSSEVGKGHHYEQIRETEPRCDNTPRILTSPQLARMENPRGGGQHSPKLFGGGGTNLRSSPDCVTLVDESQCCHNDSTSCRCYADISVHTEPLKSVDI